MVAQPIWTVVRHPEMIRVLFDQSGHKNLGQKRVKASANPKRAVPVKTEGNHMNNRHTRCTGFILNEKNQLLLLEHINSSGKKYWWFPGGGLEVNEDLETGLKREIKEELNLDIAITKSFLLNELNPERTYKRYFVGIARIDSSDEIFLEQSGKGKILRYEWFDITGCTELPSIVKDRDILPVINEALRHLGYK